MDPTTWNPGTLLALSGYYWKTCALHAGVKLDVFTAIGQDSLTAAAVAEKTQSDPRAMTRLLDALVALELLKKV